MQGVGAFWLKGKCGCVNSRKVEACVFLTIVNKRRSMSQPNDDDDDEYATASDEDAGGDDDDFVDERDRIDLDSGDDQPWEVHHGMRHLFVSGCTFVDISGGTRACMARAF